MNLPEPKTCIAFPVSIFMAGDVSIAEKVCQEYCDEVGLCVTVSPTTYIYTDGNEKGFIVGLINYPRFPSYPIAIQNHAMHLALRLRENLNQTSFTIQTKDDAMFYSWRDYE